MTREQVQLFITITLTHYRDLNLGPLISKSGPQNTRPAGRHLSYKYIFTQILLISKGGGTV
jgi:hypothetical protein